MYTKCLKIDDSYYLINMITGEVTISSIKTQDTPDSEYENEFHMSYPFTFVYDNISKYLKILIGTAKHNFVTITDSKNYITNTSLQFNLSDDLFDNFRVVLSTLYKAMPILPISLKNKYIVTFKNGKTLQATYMSRKHKEDDICFLNIFSLEGNTALFNSYNIQDIDIKFGRYEGAWPEYNPRKQKLFFDWINSEYLADITSKNELQIKQLKNNCWIIKDSLNLILKELNFRDLAQMREYIFKRTGNKIGIFPEFKDRESLLKFIKDRKK